LDLKTMPQDFWLISVNSLFTVSPCGHRAPLVQVLFVAFRCFFCQAILFPAFVLMTFSLGGLYVGWEGYPQTGLIFLGIFGSHVSWSLMWAVLITAVFDLMDLPV